MGCFEARTDEENFDERIRQVREENDNINNQEDLSNFVEEEFEDFKEIGSKHIL